MTDEFNSPAPGAPQTSDKAWAGALAAIAAAGVNYMVSGEVPTMDTVSGWGAILGSAGLTWLFVYFIPNRAKAK